MTEIDSVLSELAHIGAVGAAKDVNVVVESPSQVLGQSLSEEQKVKVQKTIGAIASQLLTLGESMEDFIDKIEGLSAELADLQKQVRSVE